MGLTVCTIAARNYLAQARVLAESFRSIHPDGRMVVLVFDDLHGDVDADNEPFEVYRLEDLGMDVAEFHRMAMIYDVTEFATAVKPWLLEAILDSGASHVLYLDPDIQVYASLDRLAELAVEHGIVLIPHTNAPYPRDGTTIGESAILFAGIYNLGFIGVGQGSRPFLAFWKERLFRECINNPHEARFVDQRWVDFVPGMFDHAMVRDPQYNVAYWNLHSRSFRWTGERYEVDGYPLAFFHFSGYSPDAPHRLSKHQGAKPRILFSDNPDLGRICDAYAASLIEHGYSTDRQTKYGFDHMADGTPIDFFIRHLYRRWVEDTDERGTAPPPDPFHPAGAADLVAMLNGAPKVEGDPGNLTLYLGTVYSLRRDIHQFFPDPQYTGRPAYMQWALVESELGRMPSVFVTVPPGTGGRSEVPPSRSASTRVSPEAQQAGITVAGYFNAELGVGEGGRLTARVVEATGIDFTTFTTTAWNSRRQHPFEIENEPNRNFDTNIVAVNADQFPEFVRDMGPEFFSGRYTIGQWAWEVEEFPKEFWPALDLVDEVWALSEFNRASIAAVTDKPVFTVPLPVLEPTVASDRTRASFGLPEGVMFLFSFDLLSILERKNPLGLIDAFQRAFSPDEGPVLVLKIINGEQRIDDLERIRWACKTRPDILIIDDYLGHGEYGALLASADCYVSLHRSEGLGLTMAEAMALGKPVIATGYSGNLDFMSSETAYLVPWTPIEVPPGCDPYPVSTVWADPDLDAAARLMRHVAFSPEEAVERGRRGREAVRNEHGVDRAVAFVRQRFEAIQQERSVAATPVARVQVDVLAGKTTPAPGPTTRVRAAAQPIVRRIRQRHDTHHEAESRAVAAALEALAAAQERTEQQQRDQAISLSRSTAAAQAELAHLQQWSTAVQKEFAQLQALRIRYEHLERDLTEASGVKISPHEIHRAVAGLLAIPYMGATSPYLRSDPDGKEVIGYSEGTKIDAEGYAGFEDVFRGTEEVIRGILSGYVPLLAGRSSVVDIGCGRGRCSISWPTLGPP